MSGVPETRCLLIGGRFDGLRVIIPDDVTAWEITEVAPNTHHPKASTCYHRVSFSVFKAKNPRG